VDAVSLAVASPPVAVMNNETTVAFSGGSHAPSISADGSRRRSAAGGGRSTAEG